MNPVREVRDLWKQGNPEEALALARRSVSELPSSGISQLGTVLQQILPEFFDDGEGLIEVVLVGQVATQFFPPLLTALAWAEGLPISVIEGGYDQAVQDVSQLEPKQRIVIFLPWHQRLTSNDPRSLDDRVNDELMLLNQVWSGVEKAEAKLIQVSYDTPGPSVLGYCLDAQQPSGHVAAVREINRAIRDHLPKGAFFIDLDEISSWHGKREFYDERNYYWIKQPFSQAGLLNLSRHLAGAIRMLTRARKRVLVLDLDNTLWGGVVGETGPLGIEVGDSAEGQPFLGFQKELSRLKDSGVILAAASKNNPEDAREPFEKNEQMHLKLDDFAAFRASWGKKSDAIREMAGELNLGLDSFVFFDDNPVERAEVGGALPMVTVVDVPEEPSLYLQALRESLAFETAGLDTADAQRAGQYQAEATRRKVLEACQSPEDYLKTLEMRAEVLPIDESNLDRVVALITKTNQFNLTTRRHSRPAVEHFIAATGSVSFAVRLEDKFGDYGIISVILAKPGDDSELEIDTWLMSCRAMSRTVEHFVMNAIAGKAREGGFRKLAAEYLPTQKNAPVAELLPGFGFEPVDGDDEKFEMSLDGFEIITSYVSG